MDLKELIEALEKEVKAQGLISIREAAELKNVSRSAILQLIQRGRLRTETVVGKQLVYKSDVTQFTNQKPGPQVGTVFKLK
jgi:excisionase family DNA binding protein